ncbi:hypothetical protein JHK82_042150 [Glycine max]|nr:hypothetical protein JHK86_042196 [Glycine max]KAG5105180.1 hypothetical protein JHK82_042150 [Glycine max]KAG5116300.1 hypothetical protein JHK84_042413 [Glycine max]
MANDDCCATQLIDGDGEFNVAGLDNFIRTVNLASCGLSYAVVAIMGPQSSGKSTLMNHLFHTSFREMDAFRGRSQTTKGIWIAKCVGIEPSTIAMDLEGTDGRERGEESLDFGSAAMFSYKFLCGFFFLQLAKDDTAFEKQSALFALAISDIVLINMWCHDIGREQAANKPLLKTVFQVVYIHGLPSGWTPLENLEPILREDIQKIWDGVRKPQAHLHTPLSEFFNVEVTALSSYEDKEDKFKEEVAQLRQRFFHSIAPGGLAGDRRGVVPASAFSISAQQIWKVIRENKDLDLPAHKVMVATVRCEEIANEKLNRLRSDKGWLELEEAIELGPVRGFGEKLSSIIDACLSQYDEEAIFFDEAVRNAKRKQLESKALDLVYPAYTTLLGHIRSKALDDFKTKLEQSLNNGEGFASSVRTWTQSTMLQFDKASADAAVRQANWGASKVRDKLHRDIDSHTSSMRSTKLSEITANFEKKLAKALTEPVESLFEAGGKDTWLSIRELLKRETEIAVSEFSASVAGFELDEETVERMQQSLRDYARKVVENKARDEAGKILIRMKDRFSTVFNHDNDSLPRVWTGKEDVRAITRDARSASLKLLSDMAAIRLDEKPDRIESALHSSLIDKTSAATSSQYLTREASVDPLASSTWEEVSPEDVLITPVQCKALWRQFQGETEYTVTQAISAQEAYKRSNNWLPPPWAIMAMVILGFNEFMLLLKNPLYLMFIFVAYLLGKAIWVQMDIAGEFRHGTLPGLLSISSKFLPTFMNLIKRLAEEAQGNQTPQESQGSASQTQIFRNQVHKPDSVSTSISNVSSVGLSVDDNEYSTTNLSQRRRTNAPEAEFS